MIKDMSQNLPRADSALSAVWARSMQRDGHEPFKVRDTPLVLGRLPEFFYSKGGFVHVAPLNPTAGVLWIHNLLGF